MALEPEEGFWAEAQECRQVRRKAWLLMARMITLTGNGTGLRVDATAQQGVQYTILVMGNTTMNFGYSAALTVNVALSGGVVHRIEGVDLFNLYMNVGASGNYAYVYVL